MNRNPGCVRKRVTMARINPGIPDQYDRYFFFRLCRGFRRGSDDTGSFQPGINPSAIEKGNFLPFYRKVKGKQW